jgi:Thermostable hemolysin
MHRISATIITPQHIDRPEIEQFIGQVFLQAYNARIHSFMPILIALRDSNGNLVAAFGMRDAANSPLFLEQYCDAPIETILSDFLGKNIARADITEIGNLAVANPRHAGILIAHVIKHSLDNGVKWCVATANRSLQNGLKKGGRDVFAIQPALLEKLPESEQKMWGSYYKNQPQIVAVRGIAER